MAENALQAPAELQDLLTDTQRMLKRSFTEKDPPSGPGPCDRPDGKEGFSYLLPVSEAVRNADPSYVARQVESFWRSRGLQVRLRISGNAEGVDVIGTTADGGELILGMGSKTNLIDIIGETACAKRPK